MTVRLRVILAAVAAQIQAGRAASARSVLATRLDELRRIRLPRSAQPWVAELHNLLAYGHYVVAEYDQAREALRALSPRPAAAIHNLAVVAEAQGDPATAARRHEQAIEAWAEAPFERVSSTYREAVMFAAHGHVAGLHRTLEQWADELRHLEACIATRPFDIRTQRASIQPLIALGEVERALHKSGWLLTARPDELDVQLDHATVLASARGAGAAIAHLDELAQKRPEALDAIRQRKAELRDRLSEVAAERAESGDWRATYSAARDVEALAETEEQQLEALRQQAEALLHMAEAGEAVSLLEQGLTKCREAQALRPTGSAAEAFAALEKKLGAALAPRLAHSADELFRHRRKAYYTLTELEQTGPPADAAEQARQLGEAFTRVAGLFERASELGGTRLANQVRARLEESRELVTKCRELRLRLGRRR
ncbi:MAG: hypothetical protein HYU66_16815 [Armatimonadetes bacterium]|nr:hypothetical protein [Armatimonadota bacterium]